MVYRVYWISCVRVISKSSKVVNFYLFITHKAAKTHTSKDTERNTLPQSTNRNRTHTTNRT